jgi:hypothetical protein
MEKGTVGVWMFKKAPTAVMAANRAIKTKSLVVSLDFSLVVIVAAPLLFFYDHLRQYIRFTLELSTIT